MRFVEPGHSRRSSTPPEERRDASSAFMRGRGNDVQAAAERVEMVKEGVLAPIEERWPVSCQIKDCKERWYTLIETRWLPKEIAPDDGLFVCKKHYKWLQFRHGRVMGYTQENGKTVSYVAEELF